MSGLSLDMVNCEKHYGRSSKVFINLSHRRKLVQQYVYQCERNEREPLSYTAWIARDLRVDSHGIGGGKLVGIRGDKGHQENGTHRIK